MAYMVDQQSNFKHFCKICKKGFGCGRALGGHMRAHGIGDESAHIDDDDPASDWEEKLGGNVPPNNKRMYALRTNPNRLKSCRVCENCGKEFLSWKAFLEHGKCSSEDAESLVSSPGSEGEDDVGKRGCGWSKRKRSLRAKVGNFNSNCPSSEEEDLANCLMMLSNATADPLTAEPEESCASASKEDQERRNPINFVTPISCRVPIDHKAKGVAKGGMFECKACKKVFNSHQALGGHRASHKKVKGCFAARLDHHHHLDHDSLADDQDVITYEDQFLIPSKSASTSQFDHQYGSISNNPLLKRRSKVHECSICHRIFSSGQALGGHKRCHWITSNAPDTSTSLSAKFHKFHDPIDQQVQQQTPLNDFNKSEQPRSLDLNLPAPVDEFSKLRRDPQNPLSFEVSTEIFLQPNWVGGINIKENDNESYHQHHQQQLQNENEEHKKEKEDNNNKNDNNNNSNIGAMESADDEADSKVKLAKLSELKDMNMSGGSSPWLQVGIGSTADLGADT